MFNVLPGCHSLNLCLIVTPSLVQKHRQKNSLIKKVNMESKTEF